MSDENKCAYCGRNTIKKIESIFVEDVNHDVYECVVCGKLTISHLYWQKFTKKNLKALRKARKRG